MAHTLTEAIALDLGSTAIKAGLLREGGRISRLFSASAPAVKSEGDRYESDAENYFRIADALLRECLDAAGNGRPVGISSQRSSFLLWERVGGQPVTPLISWQDTRAAALCRELAPATDTIHERTGLRLAPYYFAPKLCALLREHPAWRTGLENDTLMTGTLDSFVIWRWSGGRTHRTDSSMAARTLLMDLAENEWSRELCNFFALSPTMLPAIGPTMGLKIPLDSSLTLGASVADQSAAFYAGVNGKSEEALVNLGTGGFVIRPVAPRKPAGGYLRTLLFRDAGRKPHLALEGTLNSIASALAPYPYRDCRMEDLGRHPAIFAIAEPSGLGAPYFRGNLGLLFSRPVGRLDPGAIAALLLEGIIFRVVRILLDFHRMAPLRRVYLSGGLSALPCLGQAIALLTPLEVRQLEMPDASLKGAGLMAAGLPAATGRLWKGVARPKEHPPLQAKFQDWQRWFDSLVEA